MAHINPWTRWQSVPINNMSRLLTALLVGSASALAPTRVCARREAIAKAGAAIAAGVALPAFAEDAPAAAAPEAPVEIVFPTRRAV